MSKDNIKTLVDRFLTWPLPATVAADGCATNPNYAFPRSGTNLLNAVEAEAMLRHVLDIPPFDAAAGAPEVTRCYGPFGYSYVPEVVTVEGATPCDTTEESAPEPETRKGLREIHKAWEESGDGLPALIRDIYEQGFLDGRVPEEESDRGKVLTDEQIIQIADQTFAKFSDAAIGDEWFVSFAHSIISAAQEKGSES